MTNEPPDPLEPAHIPGQNPNTPQRLPGSTRFYEKGNHRVRWLPFAVAACGIVIYALLLAGAIGSGQTGRAAPETSQTR